MRIFRMMFCLLSIKTLEVRCSCKQYRYGLGYENLTLNLKVDIDAAEIIEQKIDKVAFPSVKDFVRAWILETEHYFHQAAMSFPLKLNLVDTNLIITPRNVTIFDEIEGGYLYTHFCFWKELKKNSSAVWFFSVLLTPMKLYYEDGNGIKIYSGGVTRHGSFCEISSSCTVIYFQPDTKMIANTLAHELAHSFGANHDNFTCGDNHIMSDGFDYDHLPTTWSNCTKKAIDDFIWSDKGSCLGDAFLKTNVSYRFTEYTKHKLFIDNIKNTRV